MSARKSKQRQVALKKLEKADIAPEKILQIAGEEVVSSYFFKKRNHSECLMEIDPELLQIVLQNLQNVILESNQNQNLKKTDVLSQGKLELVVACRDKGLLSLLDYLDIRKFKNYSSHSSYGKRLVENYPGQYFVGNRCTHYHCKTTARAIEQEYDIFNQSDEEGEEEENQESSEFIDDGAQQQEESQQQDSNEDDKQQQQSLSAKPKVKKRMNLLQSQSQQSIKASKSKAKKANSSNKKGKMSIEQSEHKQQDEEILLPLYQALQVLEIEQILDTIEYKILFEYLSQRYLPKLKFLEEDINEIVQLNHQKQKKNNRKKKGDKQHKKKLTKKKQNVKEMKLQDLINEYIKREMLQEKDRHENRYTLEDHPRLAFELIKAYPDEFVFEKDFTAYEDEQMNKECQQIYEQWLENLDDDENESEQQQEQEEQQEYQSD